MSFYKEIAPFVEYIHSIRKLETYLSFDMKFPIKWSIPKNIVDEGQVIAFDVEDQNTKGITFICPINEKEVSSILVKIGKTIKLNKERELKERLFKQTVEQLKQHLESKFQPGMSWDNWTTDGWHIDHIKPLSSFNLNDRKQLLSACHYTNLQPLWAKDNLSKSDKIV